jgi:hypothetical protein
MPGSPAGEAPLESEGVENAVALEAETTQDDTSSAAESSAAGDEGSKSESLLDRVTDALKPEAQPGETPDQEASQEEGAEGKEGEDTAEGGESEADDLEDDPTDEELGKYHSKTRRRVKKLISQRNEARDESEKVKTELHGFYGALRDAGVTQEGLNTFAEFSRLTYTDPTRALAVIEPIVASLREAAGEVLPADLKEKVDSGYVDETTAKELAKARQNAQRNEQQIKAQRQQSDQQRATQQREAFAGQLRTTLSTWETSWKGADPDYKAKQPFVMSEIRALVAAEGFPKTAQDAVGLADKAKKSVEDRLRAVMPQKSAVNPVTGSTAGTAKAKPNSILGAIDQALSG